ncbi:MAG: TatD family hydrolase [Planctomycetaceae bacterium]|jgi:TatD DNase family protein|nr:TatD family hydrolase [Planctomycetaceae bacterium]
MKQIPIFDTHAHLDFPQFEPDRAALIRRLETGTFPGGLAPEVLNDQPIEITGVLIPGIDVASCQRAVEMAKLSDLFHVAVAIHPNHTAGATEENWRTIAELARQENVVAIGETGLDRYWDDAPIELQRDWLHRHLELSQETGKPILIHCRDAWDDMLPMLRQAGKLHGAIHAFSGGVEQMVACVELGLFISFAGSVTYRNAKFAPLWEAAQKTPLDLLLIETDAPFMIPHPFRGKLPQNEPTLAALTALRLAELRNDSLQAITKATTQNAMRLLDVGN